VQVRDTACLDLNDFPVRNCDDATRTREQAWSSDFGHEYLVANPIFVPSLKPIITSAVSDDENFNIKNSAFERRSADGQAANGSDPFLKLPPELIHKIIDHLDSPSIATLRLTTRAVEHLPISLWRSLVTKEMPWLYEAWSSDPEPYYWATVVASDLEDKQQAEKGYSEWTEAQERRRLLHLSPVKLPNSNTNWYKLYRDITVNWSDLKGLQNRKRIWNDVMQLIDAIKWIRAGNRLKDHKFYTSQNESI
jgi:hypothetical protein